MKIGYMTSRAEAMWTAARDNDAVAFAKLSDDIMCGIVYGIAVAGAYTLVIEQLVENASDTVTAMALFTAMRARAEHELYLETGKRPDSIAIIGKDGRFTDRPEPAPASTQARVTSKC